MIKKSIKRRQEGSTSKNHDPDSRYKQATRSVVENYKQDKDSTVYTQYYTNKKKRKLQKNN